MLNVHNLTMGDRWDFYNWLVLITKQDTLMQHCWVHKLLKYIIHSWVH